MLRSRILKAWSRPVVLFAAACTLGLSACSPADDYISRRPETDRKPKNTEAPKVVSIQERPLDLARHGVFALGHFRRFLNIALVEQLSDRMEQIGENGKIKIAGCGKIARTSPDYHRPEDKESDKTESFVLELIKCESESVYGTTPELQIANLQFTLTYDDFLPRYGADRFIPYANTVAIDSGSMVYKLVFKNGNSVVVKRKIILSATRVMPAPPPAPEPPSIIDIIFPRPKPTPAPLDEKHIDYIVSGTIVDNFDQRDSSDKILREGMATVKVSDFKVRLLKPDGEYLRRLGTFFEAPKIEVEHIALSSAGVESGTTTRATLSPAGSLTLPEAICDAVEGTYQMDREGHDPLQVVISGSEVSIEGFEKKPARVCNGTEIEDKIIFGDELESIAL